MPLDNKLSNIIGTKLPQWVLNQLETRANKTTQDSRDNDNVLFLGNKTAWVRLVSSVDISNSDLEYFKNIVGKEVLTNQSSLSKNFVLFGGTSKYLDKNAYQLRSGLGKDGAYGILGNSEIQKFGYRPMPGINSVTIETQGRLGSVRSATINFKCWDKDQLDIIDALYFKLGFTMFLEWGHTFYYPSPENNNGRDPNKILSTELYSIDPFEQDLNKEDIQIKIAKNARDSEGNYDAMLGIVTNFNFSYNQEGGYDCTLRLMALGVLGDSIRINNSGNLPDLLKEEILQLNNTLTEISTAVEVQNQANKAGGISKDPKDINSYPDCIKKLPGVKVTDLKTFSRDTSKRLQDYAARAVVNNVDIFFYIDGKYQTTGFSKSGVWECRNNILYIDYKSIDETKFSYQDVITNATKNNNLQSYQTSLQENYYLIKNLGAYSYFAIDKTKNLLPIDSDKDITAFININNVQRLPSFSSNNYGVIDLLVNGLSKGKNFTIPVKSTDLDSGFGIRYNVKEILEQGTFSTDDYKVEIIYNGLKKDVYYLKLEYDYFATITNAGVPGLFGLYTVDGKIPTTDQDIQDAIKIAVRDPNTVWKIKEVSTNKYSTAINPKAVPEALFEAQTIISIKKPGKRTVTTGVNQSGQNKTEEQNVQLDISLPVTLTFNDLSILNTFEVVDATDTVTPIDKQPTPQVADNPTDVVATESTEPQLSAEELAKQKKEQQEAVADQIKQSLNYQSTLELMLRTIQVHALNKAINRSGKKDLEIGRTTYVLEIADPKDTSGGKPFLNQVFSSGVYSTFINKLVNGDIKDTGYTTEKKMGVLERFQIHSNYGFATNLMANKESINSFTPVNFKELLKAYVVPYQINQEIIKGTYTNHPVYIPLGLLLMILNHSCTIYDTKKDFSFQTPLVYIDFNPEMNFFLTNSNQLSTDPWTCLIPFEGNFEDYKKLFDPSILDGNNIQALSGSKESVPLFNPENEDYLTGTLPGIKFGRIPQTGKNTGELGNLYRGKIMNILVNIDYLVDTAQKYTYKDGTNSVYLKTFLETVLSDINKSLGNFNVLRLSYNDAGNTFQIVDDQFIPALSSEDQINPKQIGRRTVKNNTTEIPLAGKFSIAKNLEIKSEISSRLSNMIAISSNSTIGSKSNLSRSSDPFGYINTNYIDRYIPNKGEITGSNVQKNNDSLKVAASQFNTAVKDFYSTINPSQTSVPNATNYYIEKLSIVKTDDFATRASAMIPVSVNFTTDGISGLGMGQAFTIPDQLLPYTYTTRKVDGAPFDYLNNVGFVMVGLTHTIENNQWNTAVKANMIFLKDKTAFSGSVTKVDTRSGKFGVNPNNISQQLHGDIRNSSGGSTVPRNTDQTISLVSPTTSTYIFGQAKNLGSSVSAKAHGAREPNQVGQWQSENAWDLMVPAFTPVYAIFDGTVTNVNFYEDVPFVWGYRFTLVGPNQAFYTHLDRSIHKSGTKVKKGDLLGYVGQPPRPDYQWSTHLHIALVTGNLSTYLKNDGQII